MAKGKQQEKDELKSELIGLGLVAASLLSFVSLFLTSAGVIGDFIVRVLESFVGGGKFIFPIIVLYFGIYLIRKKQGADFKYLVYGISAIFTIFLTALHLYQIPQGFFKAGWAGDGGGLLGALFAFLLSKAFGLVGSYIILAALTLALMLAITNLSLNRIFNHASTSVKGHWPTVKDRLDDLIFKPVENEELDKGTKKVKEQTKTPVIINTSFYDYELEQEQETEQEPEPEQGKEASEVGTSKEGFKVLEETNLPPDDQNKSYTLPATDVLAKPLRVKNSRMNKDITDSIKILEETLDNFGVKAKVTTVSRGPAITRFEIQPAPGVKVSKIVNLADDIALSMAASGVRIEAPIPGKAAVGIEIPNKDTSMVYLRELIESEEFLKAGSKISVALGKDIAGNPIIGDLAKMPHLLIAGATGSGKSVCMNTLISSILFKASPEEVKFLMIDPKMVELITFNGVPHLIAPVVTDPKKAAGALRWVVNEMENRYSLFAGSGVKNITSFNELKERNGELKDKLPLIVVLIDELADLMMVAPADVEDAICRLAQMARAAGIHLVVATQRPSVDVITGLIKANIPSRIAFAVSSQIDSRTILDMGGAEKLLGKGDMLFFPVGAPKPIRVQGVFMSEKETEDLVTFLKNQGQPEYEESVLKTEISKSNNEVQDEDELLGDAVKIFIESGQASISMLQRRLRVGYTRAARLIDIMESKGIVGGYEGSKPRSILMTLEEYERTFGKAN